MAEEITCDHFEDKASNKDFLIISRELKRRKVQQAQCINCKRYFWPENLFIQFYEDLKESVQ